MLIITKQDVSSEEEIPASGSRFSITINSSTPASIFLNQGPYSGDIFRLRDFQILTLTEAAYTIDILKGEIPLISPIERTGEETVALINSLERDIIFNYPITILVSTESEADIDLDCFVVFQDQRVAVVN